MYIVTYLYVNNKETNLIDIYYRISIDFKSLIEWFELNRVVVDKHLSPLIMHTIDDLNDRVLRNKKSNYKII